METCPFLRVGGSLSIRPRMYNTGMEYTVIMSYDPDERVYNVSVPALPGCYTWGRTKREAASSAREAIDLYLESLEADVLYKS